MAHGVTSEWEDIHVKLGNWEARPTEISQAELNKQAIEKAEQFDPLANKNLEELKELEDDFDDDFLEQYKKKRLEEIKSASLKPQFGDVVEISKQDYVNEVTNAPKDVYVILHLHQDYVESSCRLDMIFGELAKNYIHHKFLRIKADRCIEKFPDAKVPTLIIYKSGDLLHNIIKVDKEIGNLNYGGVESYLKKIKIFPKTEDDEAAEKEDYGKFMLRRNFVDREADRSDSEDDDREYMTSTFKKI